MELVRYPLQLPAGFLFAVLIGAGGCSPENATDPDADSESPVVMSADGVPIRYEVHGNGVPALVLIHGWSCDRSYWSAQVGPLSEHNQVVTVDLGGHGESGLGRERWSIDSFGADVAAVVNELDLESVVLVGHSMGGDVAFQAARRLPGKVGGLVMADTYKQLGSPRTDAEIEAFLAQFQPDFTGVTEQFVRGMFHADADPSLVDRVALDMAAAPPDVALNSLRSSFRHAREVPRLIEELHLPVIAINPDDEPTDFTSLTRYDVGLVIMPGVGHFMMMEDPERFNSLLLEVLEQIS